MNTIEQVGRMLMPGRLTMAARRLPAAEYKKRSNCRSVLMLRVPEEEQELAWGLHQTYGAEADSAGAEQPKVLDFHTALSGRSASRELPRGSLARGFGLDDLIDWIAASRCFGLPLEQRESAISGRISLGRARNKDLFLRSQNISKLHAWFEYDAAGKLLLADAGSKNGTKVGGVQLTPREPVPVKDGVELKFGPLEGTVCSLEQFWEVASVL